MAVRRARRSLTVPASSDEPEKVCGDMSLGAVGAAAEWEIDRLYPTLERCHQAWNVRSTVCRNEARRSGLVWFMS